MLNIRLSDERAETILKTEICETVSKLIPVHGHDQQGQSPERRSNDLRVELPKRCIKLNIVIQILGSRGDVKSFITLGAELKKHGHRIRVATHDAFEFFVRDAGLEFYPMGGDPDELVAYIMKNPGVIPQIETIRAGGIRKQREITARMLEGCWDSCIGKDPVSHTPFVADAIIANPSSSAHVHCAQALGIPLHLMFTMPWTSTSELPHPLSNFGYSTSARLANYLSFALVECLCGRGKLSSLFPQQKALILTCDAVSAAL